MKLDNVPELEGEWTYRIGDDPKAGEVYYANDLTTWVNSRINAPLTFRTIIATPAKPPRLEWGDVIEGEYERSMCQHYRCLCSISNGWIAWYSSSEQPLGHEIGVGRNAKEAKSICQEHADKMHREKAKR